MNLKLVLTLPILAAILAGCDKSPGITTNQGTQSQPRVEAEAFHGEIYRSLDGQTALTLISRDECELRNGRDTLLCKYTKQSNALRVVVTALGTNQVVYYQLTNEGIQDNQNAVLLSPERYASAMEQMRLARERAENARQDDERRKRQMEAAKQAEEDRLVVVLAASKKETKTLGKFKCVPAGMNPDYRPDERYIPEVTVTDVSVKLKYALTGC